MNIVWTGGLKNKPGMLVDLVLTEESSDRVVKINDKPIPAETGDYNWQVPDDGTVFGQYTLQMRTTDGKPLAETREIVFLPNFVSFEQTGITGAKQEVLTDLEIARTNFNGPNLEFLVMNNGPAIISATGLINYSFISYFIRHVPIRSQEDLVVCKSTLLAELPVGEGQVVSLGRNPDCALGEKDPASKFEYVVTRFTLPVFLTQYLKDPDMLNNMSKFYWPE